MSRVLLIGLLALVMAASASTVWGTVFFEENFDSYASSTPLTADPGPGWTSVGGDYDLTTASNPWGSMAIDGATGSGAYPPTPNLYKTFTPAAGPSKYVLTFKANVTARSNQDWFGLTDGSSWKSMVGYKCYYDWIPEAAKWMWDPRGMGGTQEDIPIDPAMSGDVTVTIVVDQVLKQGYVTITDGVYTASSTVQTFASAPGISGLAIFNPIQWGDPDFSDGMDVDDILVTDGTPIVPVRSVFFEENFDSYAHATALTANPGPGWTSVGGDYDLTTANNPWGSMAIDGGTGSGAYPPSPNLYKTFTPAAGPSKYVLTFKANVTAYSNQDWFGLTDGSSWKSMVGYKCYYDWIPEAAKWMWDPRGMGGAYEDIPIDPAMSGDVRVTIVVDQVLKQGYVTITDGVYTASSTVQTFASAPGISGLAIFNPIQWGYPDFHDGMDVDDILVTNGVPPAESVATPELSSQGGLLVSPQNVAISCSTPDAVIRYTADGSEPTLTNGIQIASGESVLVDRSMTLQAKAWKEGIDPSGIASVTFTTDLNRPQAIAYGSTVSVDGNLSEWASSEFVPLDQIYDTWNSSPARLNADVAEAWYAARWSENKVYVAVKVRDLFHSFTDSYDDWFTRDAVELYIHTTGTEPANYFATQAGAQEYAVGIKASYTNQIWTGIGYKNDVPAEAGFQAAGKVDGDWIYYEAAITPFQHFSLDGQGLVVSPLSSGDAIDFDVTAVGNDGAGYSGMKSENLMTGKAGDYTTFGKHLLVNSGSIADLKAKSDGSGVLCSGVVSATFGDFFYLESTNRSSGIRVYKAGNGVAVGQSATAAGTIQTLPSGERYIFAGSVVISGTDAILSLGLNNKALGGGSFGGQPGVGGGYGLNNIGLLVKTTGKVIQKDTSAQPSWFVIDDGSGVNVKVVGSVPSGNPYVAVTGISSCETSGGTTVRVILATAIDEVGTT